MGRGHLCELINLAMHKSKVADCVRLVFAWLLANGAGEWLCLNILQNVSVLKKKDTKRPV